jgi:hypothetical protein
MENPELTEETLKNFSVYPISIMISDPVRTVEAYRDVFGEDTFKICLASYQKELDGPVIIDLTVVNSNTSEEASSKLLAFPSLESEEYKLFHDALFIIFEPEFKKSVLKFEKGVGMTGLEYYSTIKEWSESIGVQI